MQKFYTNASQVGKNILLRYVDNGVRKRDKIPFEPTLYIGCSHETPYKTLRGGYCMEKTFSDMNASRMYIKENEGVHGFSIHGNSNYVAQYFSREYPGELTWNPNQILGHFVDIEVHSEEGFPHADQADYPITAICTYHTIDKVYYVFGFGPEGESYAHNLESDVGHLNVMYMDCGDERNLLVSYLAWFQHDYPDFVAGWNSESFDIPYMTNRITKELGQKNAKKLSPWGRIKERTVRTTYGEYITYDWVGISMLDYLELYKKHTFTTQASYKLDHIAHVELGERKMTYEEAGSLAGLYKQNFQKYIEYNIKDVELMVRLDEKMKLIDLTYTLAYHCKINYQDTLSPVKSWDSLIYNHLFAQGIIVPMPSEVEGATKFTGAFVKDPLVGHKRWVVSCDLNSLYPHIIQQWNLGPEMIVDRHNVPQDLLDAVGNMSVESRIQKMLNGEIDTSLLKKYDVALTPNGQFFKRGEMSFLSNLMRELYAGRKIDKKQMLKHEQELVDMKEAGNGDTPEAKTLDFEITRLDNLQMSKKILMNSGYGALGNKYFRMFDLRIAEGVTSSGQLAIRWIMKKMNEYINGILGTEGEDYVVAGDTDSFYITLQDVVDKFCPDDCTETQIVDYIDNMAKTNLEPFINQSYEELADYVNAYEQRMFMAREVISSAALWTAKKRYIMHVHDSEGVRFPKPKLKIMGLEAARSTLPEFIRSNLKKGYEIALAGTEDEMIELIRSCREEYGELPLEDIAATSSLNGMVKYHTDNVDFIPRTPKHVKGAMLHNRYVEKLGLTGQYEALKDGDKIKYVELIKPNPIHPKETVVAFNGFMPREFAIDLFVDRKLMFSKGYIKPMTPILDLMGWGTEKRASLNSFFTKRS